MENKNSNFNLEHRSRMTQIPIYLGKQMRNFINMNDWKILPIAAVIATLVAVVVQSSFFFTMEGTLLGSFAVAFLGIWNGCFNSIQVVCRERAVIKREHRSGMHISSYIVANMIYQAMLCLMQTVITVLVLRYSIIHYPTEGFITKWFSLDLGICVFLVTYAADMLSLFISCLVHSTTAAMTIMPFVLIFQLLFSGSIFALPSWATSISSYTISGMGLNSVAAIGNYNGLDSVNGWNILVRVWNNEISGEMPLSQIKKMAQDNQGLLSGLRKVPVEDLETDENRDVIELLIQKGKENGTLKQRKVTVGGVLDVLLNSDTAEEYEDVMVPYNFTVGKIVDSIGREKVQASIMRETALSMYKPQYEHSYENVTNCWLKLIACSLICAVLSMVCLEFIDNDKR